MSFDKVLYTAKVHTTGGREGGASRSDDGHLEIAITLPGAGGGTNPEQLFAAAWSNCYLSAIKIVASKSKVPLPPGVAVDVEVDLGLSHGLHGLAARLNVSLPGLEPQVAQTLVEAAHKICPYSRATHGNIDVVTKAIVSSPS